MSAPLRLPCHLCGRPLVVEQWAFIWGRPVCRECRDGPFDDETGVLDRYFEEHATGDEP